MNRVLWGCEWKPPPLHPSLPFAFASHAGSKKHSAHCPAFPSGNSKRQMEEERQQERETEREKELGATSNKSLYSEFEGHYNLWHDIDLQ